MGVIGFSDTQGIRLKGWIIDTLLDYSIARVGEKPYLKSAKFLMDNGYNGFGFEEASRKDDLFEFYTLMRKYTEDHEYEKLDIPEHWKTQYKEFMPELLLKMENVFREEWGEEVRNG